MTTSCVNTPLNICNNNKIESLLQQFNNDFKCYQSGCQGCINTLTQSPDFSCSFDGLVSPTYNKLMAAIDEVLDNTKPLELEKSDGAMAALKEKYRRLQELRAQLIELKNHELQNIVHSSYEEKYMSEYNIATYSNSLLLVLASSICVYGFYLYNRN